MRVYTGNEENQMAENMPIRHPHAAPGRPVPPHEREEMLRVVFDEKDWAVLRDAFGDEDTAAAAANIIENAPLEIRILVIQLLEEIEEV